MTDFSQATALELEPVTPATSSPVPSLRNNFAWTFAGNVIYAGCQWGMLSVLAKLGSAAIVGQFTLGLAIGAPVFMFTNLQLRTVQATDVRGEAAFGDYFTLRLLATLVGLIAIVCLLPFAATSAPVRWVIFLVAVSKCVECMSDVIAGLLQREEQLKRVAISLMIRGVGSVVAFSLAFAYFRNLACAVLAMSGVWLAVLLFYDFQNVRVFIGSNKTLFRFHRRELRRLLLLGLPLGWVATFASLNANVPRYFLQHYLGLADQGIYASLAYLVVGLSLVVYALTQSVTTRLARLFSEGDVKQFSRLLTKLSMLGILTIVIGVPASFLAGRPLLAFVYRREYADHVGLLAILVASSGIMTISAFVFCGMSAARLFRVQPPVYAATVVICAVTAASLIPRHGLVGAGIAVLISSITTMVGGIWILGRTLAAQLPSA